MKRIAVKIKLPTKVKVLIDLLHQAGYDGYVVGGCVRDSLLGIEPHDWDITTNARPQEVIDLFKHSKINVLPLGIEYGTVVAVFGDKKIEVTTYRSDGVYEDNRRPSSVVFENSLISDVSRRDLTINALAYNDTEGLLDYVGGYIDLMNKTIRFVGDTRKRLSEDTLRALRAIRFKCRFNFNMSDEDLQACSDVFINNYKTISMERISDELIKVFSCKDISEENLRLILFMLGKTVIPEIESMDGCTQKNAHHIYDVYGHTLAVMRGCSEYGDAKLMLCAMLHDIGKPVVKKVYEDGSEHFVGHEVESAKLAKEILTRLKFSNSYITDVVYVVKNHDVFNQGYHVHKVRKYMSETSERQLLMWKRLRVSDVNGQRYYKEKTDNLVRLHALMDEIEFTHTAFKLKDIKINGNDILDLGIKDKCDIKNILNSCLQNCWVNPELNRHDWLLNHARKLVRKSNGKSNKSCK